MSAKRMSSLVAFEPARSGSTATTCSTPQRRSAGSRCPARDVSWVKKVLRLHRVQDSHDRPGLTPPGRAPPGRRLPGRATRYSLIQEPVADLAKLPRSFGRWIDIIQVSTIDASPEYQVHGRGGRPEVTEPVRADKPPGHNKPLDIQGNKTFGLQARTFVRLRHQFGKGQSGPG